MKDLEHRPAGIGGVAALAMLGACWMLLHPWQGLYHDGILYAGQALFARMPEIFGRDPFFAGTSQAGFSVFGWIHGFAVDALGIASGSRLLWTVAQAFWVVTIWHWAGATLPQPHRLIGATVLVGCQAGYGSDGLLSVAESFLTGRTFAEPLVAAGLVLIVHRRHISGWLSMAAAFAIHPLMAMPGIAAGLACMHWHRIRRHGLVLLPGVLAVVSVIAWAVQQGLVPSIDPQWHALILRRSPLVDVARWGLADWVRTGFPMALLLAASRLIDARWSGVWRAITACAALGVLLAAVASVTHWALGLQAQFWRWTWLAAWAAPLAAFMAATSPKGSDRVTRVAFLGAIPALAIGMHDWMPFGWALQGVSLLAVLHAVAGTRKRGSGEVHPSRASGSSPCGQGEFGRGHSGPTRASSALVSIAIGTTVTVFAASAAIIVQLAMARHAAGSDIGAASPWALGAAHTGWLIAPLLGVFASHALHGTHGSRRHGSVGVLLLALLVFTLSTAIEGRGRRAIAYEALAAAGMPQWRSAIPRDASVFWPDRMPAIWFGLERRSHASFIQLAGVVFNRSSMIVADRLEQAAGVAGAELPIDFRARGTASDRAPPTERDLIDACSNPDLDFLVLDTRFERFSPHPHIQRVDQRDFHLHACARVREVSAQGVAAS